MEFQGFSRKSLDFLIENRLQNSRDWFTAHRGDYETLVLGPLRALVETLAPAMLRIDPAFTVEPKVGRTISRIFRDVRRVRDGMLFREELWITFMRDKHCYEGMPGFYFSFGPSGFEYGYGYYIAPTATMQTMREMILRRELPAEAALAAYQHQRRFKIHGECYKRAHYPAQPPELRAWLERKTVSFDCASTDFDMLYSPRLAGVLARDFQKLTPVHAFFCAVEERLPHQQPLQGGPVPTRKEEMF